MEITSRPFGATRGGQTVTCFTLHNRSGMSVELLDWGCVVRSIVVPDRDGVPTDVVLGYDDLSGYESGSCFFGAFVGRYANRIKGAAFELNGRTYRLEKNDGENHLHGVYCTSLFAAEASGDTVTFRRRSPDGEEGYPGALEVEVCYTLTEENELRILYAAKTEEDTVVNLTNHSYFNLDGDPAKDNSEWLLTVNADSYTPVDSTFMTTGEIAPVEGTPMDFRTPTPVGERIDRDFEQLRNGHGIDHNWVLNTRGDIAEACASLESPATGIRLDVYTTEPGIQVYCGNFLDGSVKGKKGAVYGFRSAVCLETQKYPDTPNKPEWPSAVLRPGEKYESRCIYKFSVGE